MDDAIFDFADVALLGNDDSMKDAMRRAIRNVRKKWEGIKIRVVGIVHMEDRYRIFFEGE